MGWWILFGLIALGVSIYMWWDGEFGFFGFILATLAFQFLAFIAVIITNIVCGAIMSATVPLSETRETTAIYALADNRTTSGSFFLGIGSVDEDVKYYYVEKTSLGKHVSSVPAEQAYIIDSETPSLTVVTYDWEKKGWDWLGFCLVDQSYIFAVPAGSISEDYSIDLQ